jgi:ubiquinone/menaquinone biosynthesis C-methylase UbiE
LAERFRRAGFAGVRYVRLGGGAIALHIGVAA